MTGRKEGYANKTTNGRMRFFHLLPGVTDSPLPYFLSSFCRNHKKMRKREYPQDEASQERKETRAGLVQGSNGIPIGAYADEEREKEKQQTAQFVLVSQFHFHLYLDDRS